MPIAQDVKLGSDVKIFHPDLVSMAARSAAASASSRCSGARSFVCEGVTIEEEVFVGRGVMFTNDK